MKNQQGPLTVDIYSGNSVESSHLVDAVVVDAKGEIIEVYGDPSRAVFPRSAIKMVQALALLESGAAAAYGLSSKWISLACASHQGEKIHTEEVRHWLQHIGLEETAFECGAHYPFDETTKFELIRQDLKPTAVHNNCSGKHCGMLTTAQHLKENPKGYVNYDHPVQVRLRRILSEISAVSYDHAPWGIDGCSIPTYAIPLEKIAVSMAALLGEEAKKFTMNSLRREAGAKILQAVTSEPEMISGTKGLCSQIVRLSAGRAIAKTGAEGVYAGLVPAKGIAMAVKVRDGGTRAAELVALHLLQGHQGLTVREAHELSGLTTAQIKNWTGKLVGRSQVRDLKGS